MGRSPRKGTVFNSILFSPSQNQAAGEYRVRRDPAGQALSNVIIVRLPFAVPDTPLLAGRLDKIRQEGGNPFLEYQLPLAIIKFKQGFGRLIRTKTDTGIVVILDSRILSKSYGRNFLGAIPKCNIEVVAQGK